MANHAMNRLLEHVSEQCFCQQSRMTARAVTRRYGAAFASVGLEATEFSLLAALALGRSASIAGLADHLAFERTTLVRNLQRLASRGLIRPADTRSRSLRYVLTPLGEGLLKKALPLWAGVQAAVRAQLTSNEVTIALKSLSALRRATETRRRAASRLSLEHAGDDHERRV